MGKTWVAVAAICLGAGTAAVRADGPYKRTLFGRELTFASDYQPSAPAQTAPPPVAAPLTATPPAAAPSTAVPPAVAPAPPAPAASPTAPAPGTPGCAGCAGYAAPAGPTRFACVNRLIDWGTYRPLHLGVKCQKCCNGLDEGGCCYYHCTPRLYLYFLDHCKDGVPPPPPSGPCNAGCGGRGFWFPGQYLFQLRSSFGCGACGCH
jgi:hypothetical protein